MIENLRRVIFGASVTLLATTTALATSVTGGADIASIHGNDATVLTGAIYFGANHTAGASNPFDVIDGSLDFSTATAGTFQNLIGPNGPSGGPPALNTSITKFGTVSTGAGTIYIDLTSIDPGFGTAAACGSSAPGALCTPALPGGVVSPFTLEQTPVGVDITMDFRGIAYFGSPTSGYSELINLFTTQQDTAAGATIPVVLQAVTTTGYTSSWSASLSTIPVTTPEPASLLLMGAGLLGFGLVARKQTRSVR